MAPPHARKSTCPNCQRAFTQELKPGRPRNYCSDACRNQANHRKKVSGQETAHDPSRHEALLAETIQALRQAVNNLTDAVREQRPSAELLRCRAQIARLSEDVEAVAVRRGRDRGESWDVMSDALALSRDRLRKKWTLEIFDRRMGRRPSPPQPLSTNAGITVFIPQQRPPDTHRDGTPETDTGPEPNGSPPTYPHPSTPTQLLASALSYLQRRSGYTLRHLASDVRVHPSYVSRILNGERDPSWEVTAGLAVACSADAADLLPLWNAVHHVATPSPSTPTQAVNLYRAVLRGLHLAAAAPSPQAICEASDYSLTTTDIVRALNGPRIPDWPTTQHLVLALRGRPADLYTVWQIASSSPGTEVTTISAGAFG